MPDNAIWAVTGPEHDARMARELAWIATGGQTGIVGPESLEVVAQPTPNNTVRIMPGGMSIAATSQSAAIGYTSAPWQSYMRAIYSPLTVEIGSTGSSGGRTDVVGIMVDDPEFEGTTPDPDEHQYWRPHVVRNAGNNATRPEHFTSLGRPFLPLAQVRIPSSTATITNSMIHDLRFLAVTRTEPSVHFGIQESTVRVDITDSETTLYTINNIRVPQWATHVKISGTASGLRIHGDGFHTGRIRGRFNHPAVTRGFWAYFRDEAATNGTRIDIPLHGSVELRPYERGSIVPFAITAQRTVGQNTELVAEEDFTRYDLNLVFTEEPVKQ